MNIRTFIWSGIIYNSLGDSLAVYFFIIKKRFMIYVNDINAQ